MEISTRVIVNFSCQQQPFSPSYFKYLIYLRYHPFMYVKLLNGLEFITIEIFLG